MPQDGPQTPRKTRIQTLNEELILDAALEVFSVYGFRGSTVDQIANKCGLSKPNLLYYFRRKEDIYKAVLERTLDTWLEPLRAMDASGEPIAEITAYVMAKLALAQQKPEASRLFVNEILHGAPAIGDFLTGPLKDLVDEKAAVISAWIAAGKLNAVDPHHLIFAIWAMTQHYADFDVQVRAVLGGKPGHFKDAERTLLQLLTGGLQPRPLIVPPS